MQQNIVESEYTHTVLIKAGLFSCYSTYVLHYFCLSTTNSVQCYVRTVKQQDGQQIVETNKLTTTAQSIKLDYESFVSSDFILIKKNDSH